MTTIPRYIDDILVELVAGRVTDTDVVAAFMDRPRAWRDYELPGRVDDAAVAAYWRILNALPAPAPPAVRTVSDAEVAAYLATHPRVTHVAEHPDHEEA